MMAKKDAGFDSTGDRPEVERVKKTDA